MGVRNKRTGGEQGQQVEARRIEAHQSATLGRHHEAAAQPIARSRCAARAAASGPGAALPHHMLTGGEMRRPGCGSGGRGSSCS